jgi:UDP-glucose 4-epimerase
LIQAYCEGFGFRAWIFRFVSILGERYTHGHVFDFYKQLREHPNHLDVLGDGNQRKSYLYVQDCVDAILLALGSYNEKVTILNLGADEYCSVKDSISWITKELGVTPELRFAGGQRGWIGDSPFIFLDCKRMRGSGWRPKLSIREAVLRTLQYLRSDPRVVCRGV